MPTPPECNQCDEPMRAVMTEGGMAVVGWFCVGCKRLRTRFESTTVNNEPTEGQ